MEAPLNKICNNWVGCRLRTAEDADTPGTRTYNRLLVEAQPLTPQKTASGTRTPYRDNDPPSGQRKAYFPSATIQ